MIEFKRFGKTVRISNENWKGLRERFNLDRVKEYKVSYIIRTDCPLCEAFRSNCRSKNGKACPFNQFSKFEDQVGCRVFFRKLFRDGPVFDDGRKDRIKWDNYDNEAARRQLKRIQKLMDEIEKEQK